MIDESVLRCITPRGAHFGQHRIYHTQTWRMLHMPDSLFCSLSIRPVSVGLMVLDSNARVVHINSFLKSMRRCPQAAIRKLRPRAQLRLSGRRRPVMRRYAGLFAAVCAAASRACWKHDARAVRHAASRVHDRRDTGSQNNAVQRIIRQFKAVAKVRAGMAGRHHKGIAV